jgi:hypothetical protein
MICVNLEMERNRTMMYGYGIGWFGWIWMWLAMALVWLAPVGLVAAVVALIARPSRTTPRDR